MKNKITIIGCGPGAPDLITIKGKKGIENADVVIGSKRLIKDFVFEQFDERIPLPPPFKRIDRVEGKKTLILEKNYKEILDQANQLYEQNKKLVFLVSGDPLFFSYGESILNKFGKENCEVIPGVSSCQYAFSKLKKSWKGYKFFTLHGNDDLNIQKTFDENNDFALLLDHSNNLKLIKRKLKSSSASEFKFCAVSNLSLPEEKISNISFDDFDKVEEESLSILIVTRKSS